MNHCGFCGAAISDGREIEIKDPARRKLAEAFMKGAKYVHTECWEKYMTDPERQERRIFLDALAERLEAGAQEYGNKSFAKPMAKTALEIQDEALDIAGWAYVMWVQLRQRCAHLDEATREAPRCPTPEHCAETNETFYDQIMGSEA